MYYGKKWPDILGSHRRDIQASLFDQARLYERGD